MTSKFSGRLMKISVIVLYFNVLSLITGRSDCQDNIRLAWNESSSGRVHDYEFSPAEFHMKVSAYFEMNDRAPLKEAYFVNFLPQEQFDQFSSACFPATLFALLLVAEADLLVTTRGSPQSDRYISAWSKLSSLPPDELLAISRVWPLYQAVGHFNTVSGQLQLTPVQPSVGSTVFVVCHCRERLDWLFQNISNIPPSSQLHLYEKCNSTTTIPSHINATSIFTGGVFIVSQPDGPVRGDECTAYLQYIQDHYSSLSLYTVFLQSDASHHMFYSYLSTALAGISVGNYNLPFLHLNYHRHYQTTTPCMRDVERLLFNLSEPIDPTTSPLIGTYCCAQFIVRRDAILSRPISFYSQALGLVNGSVADTCSPTPPARSSHCYVLEYLWHVVFGEDRFLPNRPDDARLPLGLRLKVGNENAKRRWDDVELARHTVKVLDRNVDL